MSFNNIKTRMQSERGFTIVELLIVIVVIGILAAITIVSFNGVTARANTANAQSAAEATIKKIEAYNAENSGYPTSAVTTLVAAANASTSYYLTGVNITTTASTQMAAKPTNASTVNFYLCGDTGSVTATTNLASVTVPTGAQVGYWNFSTNQEVKMGTGITSGNAGASGTFPVNCYWNGA
jgi:prepilin-type N-terminal cleavage/methylation domain-containing protein